MTSLFKAAQVQESPWWTLGMMEPQIFEIGIHTAWAVIVFLFFLNLIYLFMRDRERGRDISRGKSRLPMGSWMRDSIPRPQDHDPSQRQTSTTESPRYPTDGGFLHLILITQDWENSWFTIKRSVSSWALRMNGALKQGLLGPPFHREAHWGSESALGVVRTWCCPFASLRESESQTRLLWTCLWGHTRI